MIAASKRIIAKISSIILWPLTMLAANIARANRKIIRRAIRWRSGPAYLVAIFWFPTMTVAGLAWAIASVHEKPDDLWPVLGAIVLVVKKVMAIVAYVVEQAERAVRALRHYRRHFRSNDHAVTTARWRAKRESE
jgi:apolipoprotein N-acyltransferase